MYKEDYRLVFVAEYLMRSIFFLLSKVDKNIIEI